MAGGWPGRRCGTRGRCTRLLPQAARHRDQPIPEHSSGEQQHAHEREAARELRERNPLVRQLWVSIVAAGIGRLQRRATRPHVRRGRAVVCDRYTLDSIVQLRHTYGERRRFGLQIALIRLLSPGPRVAFLLDVPPETALARKAEDYGAEELAAQARLYREVAEQLGAIRLDGTRPRDELCAEIARAVWERL